MHPKSIPAILALMLVCTSPHAMGKVVLTARPYSAFGEKLFQRPEIRNAPKKIIAFAWNNPEKILALSLVFYVLKRSFFYTKPIKRDNVSKQNVEKYLAETSIKAVGSCIENLKNIEEGNLLLEGKKNKEGKTRALLEEERKGKEAEKNAKRSLTLGMVRPVTVLLHLSDDSLELALKDHVRYAHFHDLEEIALSLKDANVKDKDAQDRHIKEHSKFDIIKHSVDRLKKEILNFFATMPKRITIIPGKEVELRKRLPEILEKVVHCAYFRGVQAEISYTWVGCLENIADNIVGVLIQGSGLRSYELESLKSFLQFSAVKYAKENPAAQASAFDFFKVLMDGLVKCTKPGADEQEAINEEEQNLIHREYEVQESNVNRL